MTFIAHTINSLDSLEMSIIHLLYAFDFPFLIVIYSLLLYNTI